MIGGSCHIPLKDVYIAGIIGKGGDHQGHLRAPAPRCAFLSAPK